MSILKIEQILSFDANQGCMGFELLDVNKSFIRYHQAEVLKW